jgi:hypothetical protein
MVISTTKLAGRVGFRTHITIPVNKQVLLAHADPEKTTFEGLEDTLKVTDAQWQVWDLSSGKVLFAIPKTMGMAMDRSPSLSNNGHSLKNNVYEAGYHFSAQTTVGLGK